MIRYKLVPSDCKYLYLNSAFQREDKIAIPMSRNDIFVNILELKEISIGTAIHVKLYYSDGTILEGWTGLWLNPICLANEIELYDGRFNQ